jgi:2-polyprenyl-6-methoxyphenol hydroxylase-like FAD-dependent oxidoreductase
MRVLIGGGGIGGLVAGLCLHRAGIEAAVFLNRSRENATPLTHRHFVLK